MHDIEHIQVVTGYYSVDVPKNELTALGDALQRAIGDAELKALSRAPEVFLQELPQSFDAVSYSDENSEVRAGDWILVADAEGIFWQFRILPPDPPQIGLMFIARLVRSEDGWTVPSLSFKRLR